MRITSRVLDKFGYTEGCFGCAHKQAGLYDHRQHSKVFRTHIYELMNNYDSDLEKMERAQVRLGRMPPRGEQIPGGAAPMREAAAAAPSASYGGLTPRPRPRSKRQEPPRQKPLLKPRQWTTLSQSSTKKVPATTTRGWSTSRPTPANRDVLVGARAVTPKRRK